MTVVIALRPESERGAEILDEFEARFSIQPMQRIDDGTRRYRRDAEDAKFTDFDPMLDKIDPHWRDHIENWRGERRNYPPSD